MLILVTHLLFSFAVADDAATYKTTVSMPHTLFSASYLPKAKGPLVDVDAEAGILKSAHDWLSEEIVWDYLHSSTYTRFKKGAEYAQSSSTNLKIEELLLNKYEPKYIYDWAGFCNQWAAAASDKDLATKLNNTEGLVCGKAYLPQGALKEIATALYVKAAGKTMIGYGIDDSSLKEHPNLGSNSSQEIKAHFGLDDVDPVVFYTTLRSLLKSEKGAFIDVDPGVPVWNHPVQKFEATHTEIGALNVAYLLKAKTLEASDADTARILQWAAQLDDLALRLAQGEGENRLARDYAAWYQAGKVLDDQKLFKNKTYEWLPKNGSSSSIVYAKQSMFNYFLKSRFDNGSLKLRSNLKAYRVQMSVTFQNEVPYASNENKTFEQPYQFVVITDENSKSVDSFWETHVGKRPDYLLEAGKMNNEEGRNTATEDQMRLYQRFNGMLAGEGCFDFSEILKFVDDLETFTSEKGMRESQKRSLQTRYQKYRRFMNLNTLKRFLQSDENVWGMTLDILETPVKVDSDSKKK